MSRERKMKLESIRIQNMKNVENGEISFRKNVTKKDIDEIVNLVGVYGQNGSGKTVIVDAVGLVKKLIQGSTIDGSVRNFIREGSKELTITLQFLIEEDYVSEVEYSVSVAADDTRVYLSDERISASIKTPAMNRNMTTLLHYRDGRQKNFFEPAKRYEYYADIQKNSAMERMIDLRMAKRDAEGVQAEIGKESVGIHEQGFKSFIFHAFAVQHFIKDQIEKMDYLPLVIMDLLEYAKTKVSVIEMNENFLTMTDTPLLILPVLYRNSDNDSYLRLKLEEENQLPEELYSMVQNNINMINEILEALIPGCQLGIYDQKNTLLEDGREGISFMITSVRGGHQIPLRCESAGIKKIIVLATKLMSYYNDPSYLLVIDELDTGIFEYLLGEMVEVLREGAKGQMIFTCHNLHSMELLDKECVVFTTVNEKKRYIRPKNISKNKNLRLAYLASLSLGGQEEDLYSDTDKQDFAEALEDAYYMEQEYKGE